MHLWPLPRHVAHLGPKLPVLACGSTLVGFDLAGSIFELCVAGEVVGMQ
jgi:hypothetical protein